MRNVLEEGYEKLGGECVASHVGVDPVDHEICEAQACRLVLPYLLRYVGGAHFHVISVYTRRSYPPLTHSIPSRALSPLIALCGRARCALR